MISDLKEFEKFLKICRKQGVSDVTLNGISVKLGSLPTKPNEDDSEEIPTDELTPEQLMYYAINPGAAQ